MPSTIGILIFDDAEELDFVGPWEVFTASNEIRDHLKDPTPHDRVLMVSQNGGTVKCAKGMRVIADHSFADCPPIDVLLIPGGQGTRREVENPAMLQWIAQNGRQMRLGDQRMHGITFADRGRTSGGQARHHPLGLCGPVNGARQGDGAEECALCARWQCGDGGRRFGGHRYGAVADRADAWRGPCPRYPATHGI